MKFALVSALLLLTVACQGAKKKDESDNENLPSNAEIGKVGSADRSKEEGTDEGAADDADEDEGAVDDADEGADEGTEEGADEGGKAVAKTLIGSWGRCISAGDEGLGFQSALQTLAYLPEGKVIASVKYFSDSECNAAFTAADAEKAISDYELVIKMPAPDDIRQGYMSILAGLNQEISYQSKSTKPEISGTLDLNFPEGMRFEAYKIVGGKLYMSDSCLVSDIDPEDKESCTLIGESASHRATELNMEMPYTQTYKSDGSEVAE